MWRNLTKCVVAIALLTGTVALSPPAGALESTRDPFSCDLVAFGQGFTLDWSAADGAVDRYVVERQVFGAWWWRGRTAPSSTYFSDDVAPQNAAKADYRIVAKAADGSVIDSATCTVSASTLRCYVESTASGYEVQVEGPPSGASVDYVLRRSIADDAPSSWRTRSTNRVMTDSPSPTGSAEYTVWARVDRRIVGGAPCAPEVLGGSCVAPSDVWPATRTTANPEPDAALRAAVLAADPEAEQLRLAVDGRVFFLLSVPQRDGLVDLRVLDPATGVVSTLAQTSSLSGNVDLLYVDDAGAVFLKQADNSASYLEVVRPDGSIENLGIEDSGGDSNSLEAIGRLDDGRTLLVRTETDLLRSPFLRQVIARDPFTGQDELLADLDPWTFVIGLTAEGDLAFGRSAGNGSYRYLLAAPDCVG